MTQTTIYLLVNRGDETLMLDGSLYLFNELFTALNNATKVKTESITPPAVEGPSLGDPAAAEEMKSGGNHANANP